MSSFKRQLAIFLAACMVMTNVLPAFAEPASELTGAMAQENVSAEDKASPSNAKYEKKDMAAQEEASPADAEYADLTELEYDLDDPIPEVASPSVAKHHKDIFETVVDGVRITVIADKDVFPEGAELWAEKVEDADTEEAIDKAIEEEKSEEEAEKNIASKLQFDIKMFFNGIEIQPDTSKGTVKISFAFEEELNNCLDVNVYHVTGEDDALEAEALDTEVATGEEANEEDEIVSENSTDILPEIIAEGTVVSAGINGFSYYVVEFTYNELQYVLNGDESVKLSAILETLQLKGTVTAAEVSNEVLFTVTEDEDRDDWTVTALQAFSSKEWMKVTIGGHVYEIIVTDAQEDASKDYLYFEAVDGNVTVELQKNGNPSDIKLKYATASNYGPAPTSDSDWKDFEISTEEESHPYSLSVGDRIYLRASDSNAGFSTSGTDQYSFAFGGEGKVYSGGNIMSLLSASCSNVNLTSYCFAYLFSGCTALLTAPSLPATKLARYCYYYMFSGCEALETASELPATKLAEGCYESMFIICTNLKTAPALPATELAKSCYSFMFLSCSKLKTAPALPATTLAHSCYTSMFDSCTELEAAPALPATTLAQSCYANMFASCYKLSKAPVLPATTLAQRCYNNMFANCYKLSGAAVLPAATWVEGCYASMFYNCSSLNRIEIAVTSWPDNGFTGWTNGVSTSGMFVCPYGLEKIHDTSHIPEGWTVDYKYVVSFNTNGHGTAPLPQFVASGAKVIKPKDDPSESGCIFEGWYSDSACSVPYDFNTTTVENSFTLYAKWKFTVTLDAQKGSGGTESFIVSKDSEMIKITIPQRERYVFAGYFTGPDGSGSQYYDIHGTPLRVYDFYKPNTFYAYWIYSPEQTEQFIVSFDSKGGSAVPAQLVASGSTASDAAPSRTGYILDGWYAKEDCSGEAWKFDTDTVTENTILYAKWTPLQYEISWNDYNDVTLKTSSAAYGELPVCPDYSPFAREGYVHTGWTPAVEVATKSVSYKATYEEKLEGYHVVSFDSQGGSAEAAVNVLHNHTLASPSDAPKRTGYEFGGWKKTDGNAFGFGTEKVTEDMILTASWTPEEYTITWSVDGRTSTSSCAYGELPAYSGSTDKTGHVFTGWSPAITAATSAITYTAQYYEIVHVHTPQLVPGQSATCTEAGYKDCYQCTGCNKYFETMSCTSESKITDYEAWKNAAGKTDPSGHSAVQIPAKAATTTEYGIKAYWYCGNCKLYYADNAGNPGKLIGNAEALESWKTGEGRIEKITPAHVHTPEKISGQKATCTADGWNDYYQCQGEGSCSAYFADFKCASKIENLDDWKTGAGKIPAAGHNVVMIPQKDATAEAYGIKAYWYCGNCKLYYADNAGNPGTLIGNAEALELWKTGDGKIDKKSSHTHNYGTAVYIWGEDLSTCTAYHTCTEAACGHTEVEAGTVTEESGTMKAVFTNPSFVTQTKQKPVPGHEHTYAEAWSRNEAVHWHAATCGHTDISKDMAAHTWGTGDNTNKCTICGYEKASPEPVKVVVNFNSHGGSYVSSQQVEKGKTATKPSDPTRSSYTFNGWFTDSALTAAYSFSTPVTADITLYAKWTYNGRSSGGGGGGGGGGTVKAGGGKSTGATFSQNWFADSFGVWRIKDSTGKTVVNAWLCDDAVMMNGKNVWYLLTQDGAMLAAGLVQDNTGNFYSLETEHNGYFGMLRYTDGYYNCNGQSVYLTFNKEHNGSFGAVTNADGLEKLKEIYGITKYGIGNENSVYTAAF